MARTPLAAFVAIARTGSMSAYISTDLRRQVRADAGERCGYCLSWALHVGLEFDRCPFLFTIADYPAGEGRAV